MPLRVLAILFILGTTATGYSLADNGQHVEVGDHVFIKLTGDLAKEYVKCNGIFQDTIALPGLEIETSAVIVQKLENGFVRLEHSSLLKSPGKQDRLVTLTTTVENNKITSDVSHKGQKVFASPAAYTYGAQPSLLTEETKNLRLTLSDFKYVKLRTWKLDSEIGD